MCGKEKPYEEDVKPGQHMIDFTNPETYDKMRVPHSRFHSDKYRKMFDIIKTNKNMRILEFGCGTGVYTKFLREDFDNVVSIDIDPKMINISKKKTDANLCVADCNWLPIKPESMDIVIGISVLHHIKDYSVSIREAYRVLKHGGYVVFFEPNKFNPLTSIFQAIQKEASMSRFELKRAFVENGFAPIKFKEVLLRYMSFPQVNKDSPYSIIERLAEMLHLGVTLLAVGRKDSAP